MAQDVDLEVETADQNYYTWEVPGKPISIRIDFDVVDRIAAAVMQGFGSVPRRGAEVGGLLLGSVSHEERPVVHVRGFEAVACEHARGPSYMLSDADEERLVAAMKRWRPDTDAKELAAVGFCRSHTREGMGLTEEDVALFNACFPGPANIFLLVKPFASRPCSGAFFFRENGEIRGEASYLEFPFRRRELGGGSAPAPKSGLAAAPAAASEPLPPRVHPSSPLSLFGEPAAEPVVQSPKPKHNLWIPLSFIFLLVGIVLGFQVALSFRPAGSMPRSENAYKLSMNVSKSGDTVQVRWDRDAPAIQQAKSAILTIADGASSRTLELDQGQLFYGTVIYRYLTNHVKFKLEVLSNDNTSLVESVEIHTGGAQ